MSNKDLTIHLKIKTLRVPVTERLPVIVIWSRQSKQAKTKKRLLSDQAPTTVFDEEFQISTSMMCDEEGNPTKPKMVSVTQQCRRTFSSKRLLANHRFCASSLNSRSPLTKLAVSWARRSSTWLCFPTTTSRR